MTLNLKMIKPFFLPLTFICLGVFSGQMGAKAEPSNTAAMQNQVFPPAIPLVVGVGIDTNSESPSTWRSEKSPSQVILNPAIQRKASLLGKPLTLTNRSATTSGFQSSPEFR